MNLDPYSLDILTYSLNFKVDQPTSECLIHQKVDVCGNSAEKRKERKEKWRQNLFRQEVVRNSIFNHQAEIVL